MWWDRSELMDVYFSTDCIGLINRRCMDAAIWIETYGLDEAAAAFVKALSQLPFQSCGRVRVWLGAPLARPLILPAESGARTREEAKGLATMLAPDAAGLEGPVRVWANAWRPKQGGLAVVMPVGVWSALHGAIDQACEERMKERHKGVARSLKLVSVQPWWSHVFDAVIDDSVEEDDTIGWSLTEGRSIVHGVVSNGIPLEAGFDLLGDHDVDGTLLRRRLQVNWNAISALRHLEFARHGDGVRASLGCWRTSGGGLA